MSVLIESPTFESLEIEHPDTAGQLFECPVAGRVERALQQAPYRDLHSTTCTYRHGVLTLRGTVCSYYHKQVAQEIVRHVDGVEKVCNRIEVKY